MQLPLQDFSALVRTQAAAAKGAARELVDLSVGSVLRAVLEANASVGLWLQWLITEVLATTRAATSTGADLDTWVADFGLRRLPGVAATGIATFSRTTAGLSAVVPVGALAKTGTGTDALTFTVAADPGNPAWTGAGFLLRPADASVSVPVQCATPGRAGNVKAGEMRLLGSAIPGVDAVTNADPAAGGLDPESDAALRARFGGFIDSRTRATAQAVGYAVQSAQQGLSFVIAERTDAAGLPRPGHFTVVIDDGTGHASPDLLARASAAIEAVRPLGGTFSVRAPTILPADVSLYAQGPDDAKAAVRAALTAYISALPMGAGLVISRLIQIAHDADPRIERVTTVLVDGVASDLAPPPFGLLRPGAITVLP